MIRKRKRTTNDGLGPMLDGDYLTVGMTFMDSAHRAFIHDESEGEGHSSPPVQHRPGQIRLNGDPARASFIPGAASGSANAAGANLTAQRTALYNERDKVYEQAWLNPVDPHAQGAARPGKLTAATDDRNGAYEAHNNWVTNAWKSGR